MQATPRGRVVVSAFTIVELIAMLVVLVILSGVAVPRYFEYTFEAKASTLKGTLAGVRSAIASYYAQSATSGEQPMYPSVLELRTVGRVLHEPVAGNPFVAGPSAAEIQEATFDPASPPVTGTTHGWNYDAATGKFWANTVQHNANTW